jgi:glucose dehydrogenase
MTRAIVLLIAVSAFGCTSGDAGRRSAAGASAAVDVPAAERARDSALRDTRQWPEYGRDFSNQRWSPLNQITSGNVGQLKPAWIYHSGIPQPSETNPIVIDGVMYFTTALNHVLAVDARTGAKKWEYAYDYAGHTVADCCSTNNKGPAVYGGRVFMATVDARLVALDATNGHEL